MKPPEMPPITHFIIHFVKSCKLISAIKTFDVEATLSNFVHLELSADAVKPGETVAINIASNPNSFIGLMSVDASTTPYDIKRGDSVEYTKVFDKFFPSPRLQISRICNKEENRFDFAVSSGI